VHPTKFIPNPCGPRGTDPSCTRRGPPSVNSFPFARPFH
jgi:hypothetical protein